jgi:peptidoglycan/xylan/chitin deacetylase (PgdA/CDA1 family)
MRSKAAAFLFCLAFALGSISNVKLSSGITVLSVSKKDASEVTALESDLEMLGIPYETTRSVAHAVQAPIVVLAGTVTNAAFSAADRELLYSFVESGGVLFATHVQASQFFPLFGINDFSLSRANFGWRFVDASTDPILRYVNRVEERHIVLGDPKRYHEFNWTTEYHPSHATALGVFPNGSAAFIRNDYGRGIAYSLGLSFSDSTLRLGMGQSYDAELQWANVFAPSGDVIRMLLRAVYESNVHPFILIHTIPDGLESALLLSHDIDARESFRNSVAFAALEQRYGAASTFFVTTKYFSDETDAGYYTPQNAGYLREVFSRGFDLGSHTVSHLKSFNRFPLGESGTRLASYRPLVAPSVFGEVDVSKEMLERDIPGQHTISFRAGELSHPPQLITALETAGYLVDSTRAAGNTLTNYAYRPLREAHLGSAVSSMIEIPVTLDDSMGFLTSSNVEPSVARWLDIITANAENNNVTCLLIHPTDTTYKISAEEWVLQASRQKPFWIGSVTRFGLFARARASVRLAWFASENQIVVRLNQPRAALPPGLTLALGPDPRSPAIVIRDNQGADVPFTTTIRPDRKLLILKP